MERDDEKSGSHVWCVGGQSLLQSWGYRYFHTLGLQEQGVQHAVGKGQMVTVFSVFHDAGWQQDGAASKGAERRDAQLSLRSNINVRGKMRLAGNEAPICTAEHRS